MIGYISVSEFIDNAEEVLRHLPLWVFLVFPLLVSILGVATVYLILLVFAPHPRPSTPSEKTYLTIDEDGSTSKALPLPCWYDSWKGKRRNSENRSASKDNSADAPEVFMSVVVPAYNEEQRLPGMLEEAVDFLEREYGSGAGKEGGNGAAVEDARRRRAANAAAAAEPKGWEIIIVSDGSSDRTVSTSLEFARNHVLSANPKPVPGPRTPHPNHSTHIPPCSIRVVELVKNRGKGGAVTHGMRHVRGKYAVFADADGATKFDDLAKMVVKAQELASKDSESRAVIIGSRSHLVDSEAVVKRSLLRNALMYTFHLFIRLLTTPVTSRIADTQCGFKLFTRTSLPYIIPYMHSEGWIFDVEMLMLTEAAKIPMIEVPVGWKEVGGSKLNVIWASLDMAWGLAVVRGSWEMGIWKRF